jgi:molybdate transport system substrate-binding protein
MQHIRAGVFALALAAAMGASGCDSRSAPETSGRVLTVFAASSLSDAFRDIEAGFESKHPDVDVTMNFAGSQVLRVQIEQGADADVYVSADRQHMSAVETAGLATSSRVFAHNELTVIVPSENPAGIETFEDLVDARRIVLGTRESPIGTYTEQMLANASRQIGEGFVERLRDSVVSRESNVRLVRAKVEMGEADAAIVYRTDAMASDGVRRVAIPDAINVRASYPVAALQSSGNPDSARDFVRFVLSTDGQAILERHGFVPGGE